MALGIRQVSKWYCERGCRARLLVVGDRSKGRAILKYLGAWCVALVGFCYWSILLTPHLRPLRLALVTKVLMEESELEGARMLCAERRAGKRC